MNRQKTISKASQLQGQGLFSGQTCTLRFEPAAENSGIVFIRATDNGPVRITADIAKVVNHGHRTSLSNGKASVETVEHVLAAAAGFGVDNLTVKLDKDETPSIDGSPLPFLKALQASGIVEQQSDRRVFIIDKPYTIHHGEAMLAALPGPGDYLDILYDLDYSFVPSIGRQIFGFRLGKDDFASMLAPARTFALEEEARQLLQAGLCKHLSARDVLVMGPKGPIENTLRFPDEHVRHKICDLIGDLSLLGRPIHGRIVAYKSGHDLNHALVRKLSDAIATNQYRLSQSAEPLMDIRKIMRLLPHRYPFLMIDRIISIEGDQRAVGIKNVSINEPYFQGHWPGQPVMPGVLILEALAQLSGILLSRRLEHTGKIAVLLSLDRVKMRRLVRPGDQLILETQTMHIRPRSGHCRCRALVGEELAVEAEIKFMLVDSEPA